MRERGWGSPNSDEGTYTVVLIYTVYKYFVMYRAVELIFMAVFRWI